MAPVQLRKLSKVYGRGTNRTRALRKLDLDVRNGEVIVVLGPKGSGKSTLLNILAGLERPSSGTYLLGRRDLTAASDRALETLRRRRIGLINQVPKFLPQLSMLENVKVASTEAPRPMRAEAALTLVGLGKFIHALPSQLTETQRYLAAIARAVAKRPDLLICDQPTEALSLDAAISVVKMLEMVSSVLDLTTFVSTRSIRLKSIGNRVVYLLDGRLVGERQTDPVAAANHR
ncbi:MAG: ATP-binding cassette domain-containing protein [Hyphomicrobiaceae bacterium]